LWLHGYEYTREHLLSRQLHIQADGHRVPCCPAAAEAALDQREVVPGDIVRLYAGEMLPGDVRVLRAKDLFVG
jgi:magnesium-transporting ATPase (P-type)